MNLAMNDESNTDGNTNPYPTLDALHLLLIFVEFISVLLSSTFY